MNYLDTTKNGGHPLYLEDLGFIQDAYKEAIAGITQGLGADSYILSGCQKTTGTASNTWNISAGFVVLDGEVFKVGAHTVNYISVNDPLFFKIHTETIYPSPAIYHDMPGDEFDVHHRRTAIVTTEVTNFMFKIPILSQLIDRSQKGQVFEIPLLNGWEGHIYGQICHGFFYLFGKCSNTSRTNFSRAFVEIPGQCTPILISENESFGLIRQLDEDYPGLTSIYSDALFQPVQIHATYFENHLSVDTQIIVTHPLRENYTRLLDLQPPRSMYVAFHKPTPSSYNKVEIQIPMGSVMWPVQI